MLSGEKIERQLNGIKNYVVKLNEYLYLGQNNMSWRKIYDGCKGCVNFLGNTEDIDFPCDLEYHPKYCPFLQDIQYDKNAKDHSIS